MGTKNNPGVFDCYAAAEPDEPMFVLLGRDRHAAALVNLWATMREIDGEDAAKVAEAGACADAMVAYRHDPHAGWMGGAIPAGLRTLAEGLVLMAAQHGMDLTIAKTVTGAEVTFTPRLP
jgi:hypothetical protein